jgi:mannose-6-phosphate isomerase-like protein (cupin superfamily)
LIDLKFTKKTKTNQHDLNESEFVEKILSNKNLIAIIIRSNFQKEGVSFFTPHDLSQQLAYMQHHKGTIIQPHVHNKVTRKVSITNEFLYIRKGVLKVDFYDDEKIYIESKVLQEGDVILLVSGGHGFEILEYVEMIEVKQGPYTGEEDKIRFDGI